jgi:hypothetical protein
MYAVGQTVKLIPLTPEQAGTFDADQIKTCDLDE